MGVSDFWGWNIVLVGVVLVIILMYLIVLFQKRRKAKFTHEAKKQ